MATLGAIPSNTELATFANINPTGLTSGDALVTADGVTFVPGKVVTKNWGVGQHLSVTGNAVVGGTLGVTGTTTLGGVLNVSGAVAGIAGAAVSGLVKFYKGSQPSQTAVACISDSTAVLDLLEFQVGGTKVMTVTWNSGGGGYFGILDFPNSGQITGVNQLSVGAINVASSPFDGYLSVKTPNAVEPSFAAYDSSNNRVFTVGAQGVITSYLKDAGTSAVTVVYNLGHNSTGTPAGGFGSELRFQLESTTTEDQNAAGISVEWATATHASRAALCKAYAYYTSTARECFRWEADSSTAKVGFLGATAAAQQTGGSATAGAAYGATEQTMLQKAYDALRTFGYLS